MHERRQHETLPAKKFLAQTFLDISANLDFPLKRHLVWEKYYLQSDGHSNCKKNEREITSPSWTRKYRKNLHMVFLGRTERKWWFISEFRPYRVLWITKHLFSGLMQIDLLQNCSITLPLNLASKNFRKLGMFQSWNVRNLIQKLS